MLNWLLRYQPVLDVLEAEPSTPSVLDVGSGWFGLTWYWPHKAVQTDLWFPSPAPSGARPGHPVFVRATADQLPFADDSFDVVVSLDMVEHLPQQIRQTSIQELTRVARRLVVLAFPEGDAARQLDRVIAVVLRYTPGRSVPPWLNEHLSQQGYPDDRLVAGSLPPGWMIASQHGVGNAVLQGAAVLAEELPGLHWLTRSAERRLLNRGVPTFMNAGRPYRKMYLLRPTPPDA